MKSFHPVLGFPREIDPTGCMYLSMCTLAHMAVGAWKVQNLQGRLVGWRPREELCFNPGKVNIFILRPSIDWMRPTHITEGNLLDSKSTDLNINLIHKTPKKHPEYCSTKYLGTVAQLN